MKKKQRAIALARKALAALDSESSLHEQGRGAEGTVEELSEFRRFTLEILRQIEGDRVPPKGNRRLGMGRAVVDSWPLDSPLGNLLCSVEQAYRDL